jgi:hypothetical protein
MNRLDNENLQENFYHTLTPFSVHSQYEECPIHHRLVNYSSDTLTFSNNSKKIDRFDSSQPFSHVYYHHSTCQRQFKGKGIITPLVNKGLSII